MADYMVEHEAASYLRKSPRTLQRLRQLGTGPRYYRAGRRILYTVGDLDDWVQEGTRTSAASLEPNVSIER